mmetsp:Transcript_32377/g.58836  ORF Transcript_32377/g.58836 Transcript_32377/m.58836 type:complete len:257 (+) Transcript_32377:356-1126(+)
MVPLQGHLHAPIHLPIVEGLHQQHLLRVMLAPFHGTTSCSLCSQTKGLQLAGFVIECSLQLSLLFGIFPNLLPTTESLVQKASVCATASCLEHLLCRFRLALEEFLYPLFCLSYDSLLLLLLLLVEMLLNPASESHLEQTSIRRSSHAFHDFFGVLFLRTLSCGYLFAQQIHLFGQGIILFPLLEDVLPHSQDLTLKLFLCELTLLVENASNIFQLLFPIFQEFSLGFCKALLTLPFHGVLLRFILCPLLPAMKAD